MNSYVRKYKCQRAISSQLEVLEKFRNSFGYRDDKILGLIRQAYKKIFDRSNQNQMWKD